MEIRKVDKKSQNEYPECEKIDNQKIKESIPKKWKKIGINSVLIGIMLGKNGAYAVKKLDLIDDMTDVSGIAPVQTPLQSAVGVLDKVSLVIQIVSFLVAICTGIKMLLVKNKSKKKGANIEVPKWVNLTCKISLIVLVVSSIIHILLHIYSALN